MAISLRDPETLKRIEMIQARREERDASRAKDAMDNVIRFADVVPGSEAWMAQVDGAQRKTEIRSADQMLQQQSALLQGLNTQAELDTTVKKTKVSKAGLFGDSERKQKSKTEEPKVSRTPTLK